MFSEDLWKKVENAIDGAAPEAFALSDWLGAHPEIGGEEFEAVKKHAEFLRAHGCDVTVPAFGIETAYHAVMGSGGRRVGLLAEYDALAGLGHGCGHNAHGAMTLLAATGLRAALGDVAGTVEVFGTPAEETYGGKVVMADRGAFDGLDFAMMIHCSGGSSGVPYRALACRGYEFTFEGKSAHAASAPWKGVNALNAVRILFDSLDMWRQHLRPEVRIMGIVTK
ncbi:MAG: M20/M25/M40 family metallo-hydrolase, partial [Pyramidobacter sp.]|nr:M20/M25/M40 family metallo-hydrolase [Pyramidobacter sp.]